VATDLSSAQWHQNINDSQWEIAVKSIEMGGQTLVEKDQHRITRARVSASEKGIALPYSKFQDIQRMLDYFSIDYDCDDNGSDGKSICWHTSSCGDIGQIFITVTNFLD
jgi:hypothetical protein